MRVEEFMSSEPPRRRNDSQMKPFLKEILMLRESGYTLISIKKYLEKVGVSVTISAIHAYSNKHSQKASAPPALPTKNRDEVKCVATDVALNRQRADQFAAELNEKRRV